jgi:hypothetical protein
MIVVGLDVHKYALTAVAVDELGRAVAERRAPLLPSHCSSGWARSRRSDCGRSKTAGT